MLSATLVPLFTAQLEDDDEEATSAVVTVSVIAMAALTAVAVVAAPLIFRLFSLSPSAAVDAEQYRRVGHVAGADLPDPDLLLRADGPRLPSLLNARRRFFAAAWAPVLANVVIIGILLVVPSVLRRPRPLARPGRQRRPGSRWTLGLGATVGIAVMALVAGARRSSGPACASGSARRGATRRCASC